MGGQEDATLSACVDRPATAQTIRTADGAVAAGGATAQVARPATMQAGRPTPAAPIPAVTARFQAAPPARASAPVKRATAPVTRAGPVTRAAPVTAAAPDRHRAAGTRPRPASRRQARRQPVLVPRYSLRATKPPGHLSSASRRTAAASTASRRGTARTRPARPGRVQFGGIHPHPASRLPCIRPDSSRRGIAVEPARRPPPRQFRPNAATPHRPAAPSQVAGQPSRPRCPGG